MKFDELCKKLKNRKILDFYKQKKHVEFDNQPERLNPEDTSVKTYHRSDDGVYEPLEACICDSPNSENKQSR